MRPVVVDTNIWIEFFKNGQNASLIESLLDQNMVIMPSMVKIELLSGARKNEVKILKPLFSSLREEIPKHDDWLQIETWITIARAKGKRFYTIDFLIASMAHRLKACVYSLDSAFKEMQRLGFIEILEQY